jgi:hypothetical protein
MTTTADQVAAHVNLDLLAYDISDVLDKGDYGFEALTEIGADELRPFLAHFLGCAIEYARTAAAAQPTTADGRAIHTCNGDNRSGLPFGRLAAPGTCARCDERRAGAPARERFDGRTTAAQRDAAHAADVAAHFASAAHRGGQCGIQCTYGEW